MLPPLLGQHKEVRIETGKHWQAAVGLPHNLQVPDRKSWEGKGGDQQPRKPIIAAAASQAMKVLHAPPQTPQSHEVPHRRLGS